MNILINILLGVNLIVCILMIVIILMQRSKSDGVGAAFGGGAMDATFGSDTGNVLSSATVWLAGTFFALTLTLSLLFAHRSGTPSEINKRLKAASVVGAVGTTAAPVLATPATGLGEETSLATPTTNAATNQSSNANTSGATNKTNKVKP
ncbi:MAG: preprotein translocase subunit SecG [Verrucomicrobiota bacterium]|nr:preprotein translocase subunit SecG [Verrucomicrobiota bacterium]